MGTYVHTRNFCKHRHDFTYCCSCVPDIYNLFLETKIMTVHFVKKVANG